MKSFIALLIVVLGVLSLCFADTECPLAPAVAEDRRLDKSKLRVVQYNVEWLFLDYCSSAKCPGTGCPWVNETEAFIHLKNVKQVIRDLNPDIINFCEIEGCDELAAVKEDFSGSDYYNMYLKKGTDTSTGQNVGILTKVDPIVSLTRTEDRAAYPIPGSMCGYSGNSGTYGVSKHYFTEFALNDMKLAMIGLHFLAIPTDVVRCAEREAQATVLQSYVYDYISRGYEVVVLGDFNDYDLEVKDSNNSLPNSMVLDILKGTKGSLSGKFQLTNIASLVSQDTRNTNWWDKDGNCVPTNDEFTMIDHILVTDGLKSKISNAFVYHGYSEYCDTYDSDHFPVVVDFQF